MLESIFAFLTLFFFWQSRTQSRIGSVVVVVFVWEKLQKRAKFKSADQAVKVNL